MKNRFRLAWLAVGVVLTISGLAAQDVTVTDPAWMERENPPPVPPPQFKKAPRPDYPDEMKKAETVGYVIVPESAGINGENQRRAPKGTNPYFEKALRMDEPKLLPALNDGKPVEGLWWYAVIFNPASASTKRADAAPRLSYVEPVFVAKKHIPKGTKIPLIVWGTVSLDEKGVPQKTTLDDAANESFSEEIGRAVERWRFSPARKDKIAVAGELHVPFFIVPPYSAAKQPQNFVPAKITHKEPAVYPQAMKRSGLRGEVLLGFVITKEGNVSNVVVLNSNNPGFNEAAIEALKEWKFEPAQHDGKPEDAKMRLTIVFSKDYGARDFATVEQPSKKDQDKLPEQYRYDVAPQPQGVLTPVYPYQQLRDKIEGKVTVVFLINEDGKISDVKVMEATSPDMGQAMVAAVESFSFLPALKDGKPTSTIMKMAQVFDPSGFKTFVTGRDHDLLSLERKHPERIYPVEKLDSSLNRISSREPEFPAVLARTVDTGEAKIEFLIDEEGYVRLPRIVEATDPAFGYIAAQAVSTWRYDPPVAGGQAVVARVQMPFWFKQKAAAEKPGPILELTTVGSSE